MNFKATYQDQPLVMLSQTYAYPDGSPLKFQLFNYYVSDITLLKEGETEGHLLAEVTLNDYSDMFTTEAASRGISYTYKEIPAAKYNRIKLGLGLAPDLNATQPGDYQAGHPLTENYWSWALGYVFAKIEANADVNRDGQFDNGLTYHMGKDELYKVITLDKPIVISDNNTPVVTFSVDVYDILRQQDDFLDITVPANTQDHSNNQAI
ncbi:MAG: MbnP family protein [Saprospiraceae bacterium]